MDPQTVLAFVQRGRVRQSPARKQTHESANRFQGTLVASQRQTHKSANRFDDSWLDVYTYLWIHCVHIVCKCTTH
jgi:hypothetical protein